MQVGRSHPELTRNGQLLMDKLITWIVSRKCTPSTFIVHGVRPYAGKHRNFTIVVEYA